MYGTRFCIIWACPTILESLGRFALGGHYDVPIHSMSRQQAQQNLYLMNIFSFSHFDKKKDFWSKEKARINHDFTCTIFKFFNFEHIFKIMLKNILNQEKKTRFEDIYNL